MSAVSCELSVSTKEAMGLLSTFIVASTLYAIATISARGGHIKHKATRTLQCCQPSLMRAASSNTGQTPFAHKINYVDVFNLFKKQLIVSESSKFQYRADTSYQYKYSIDITTLFDGTSKNVSSLYVDAEFNIDFISPCEAVLQVTEAHLKEKEPTYNSEYEEYVDSDEVPHSTFFSKAISQYSMRFSFNDGIVTELCPHAEETSWVLNFKRGVLSAFQNSMERFDIDFDGIEVDVNGECLTSYKLGSARATSLIISKKKDISNCVNRYKHHSILQSTPYIFRSNHQSLPVMKSKSECELVVDHNIYSKISCQEEHVFQPFSGHGSGATTRTSAIVTFLSENNITLNNEDNIEKRTSLLFDHNLTTKPTSGELKTSRDLIKAMCRLNADDVQSGFPNVFTEFIHTARLLSYPALTQLFNRAGAICNSGRKHIVDALPFLGSNAAIAVIRDVIIKNGVSKDIIKEWLFALSFVPRGGKEGRHWGGKHLGSPGNILRMPKTNFGEVRGRSGIFTMWISALRQSVHFTGVADLRPILQVSISFVSVPRSYVRLVSILHGASAAGKRDTCRSVDITLVSDTVYNPVPDLTTVTLLSPLMTQDKADAQYILAVSSVVHSYCKWYPNCNEQYEIIEIVHILEAEINLNLRNIQGNRTAQEKVIVAFKALGNIGISTITLGLTLKECFENIHLPKEIRIAAIEAHRRMPCEDHRDYFLTLFRDQKVDPEIRISLYLEVMKCPTYTVVKTIKHSLNHEEVNQVGSFVWSHLQNLLKSSIPSRVEIQGLLQDKDLSKKFSSDVRKFSRNFEGSVFFDEYNAGGNFESNVIFSPKSYLPRSAMMNLTVDLFGESINIFEVSGRVEGFENYIESIFGPMGPFNAKRVKEMVDKYRFLRSVPDQLVDKVEALPNVIDNNFGNPKFTALKVHASLARHSLLDEYLEKKRLVCRVKPRLYRDVYAVRSMAWRRSCSLTSSPIVKLIDGYTGQTPIPPPRNSGCYEFPCAVAYLKRATSHVGHLGLMNYVTDTSKNPESEWRDPAIVQALMEDIRRSGDSRLSSRAPMGTPTVNLTGTTGALLSAMDQRRLLGTLVKK
uniref:Vitellogenin domain-containing protein n=1 Tax=Timema cristinae TaxID=61476 RepID=A0A7R9CLW8_TIMCR|nr:unnamed protein product [Timema cristinae]